MRPRSASACTSSHGPWQTAATVLPGGQELAHDPHRVLVDAQFVGIHHAARDDQRVVVGAIRVGDLHVGFRGAAQSFTSQPRMSSPSGGGDIDLRACVAQPVARNLELGLLEAVGGDDEDAGIGDVWHGISWDIRAENVVQQGRFRARRGPILNIR